MTQDTTQCPRCDFDEAEHTGNSTLISRAHLAYAEEYDCPACSLTFEIKV